MKPSKIALLFTALLASTAWAQTPAPVAANSYKVGYVNVERIMRDSRTATAAQKAMEADFAKREKEIGAGPEADRQRRGYALAEEFNQRRDDEMKVLLDKANNVLRRIAEAEKFDAVFFEAAYASTRIDITDSVIKALDAAR
jgi:outer membrane protein